MNNNGNANNNNASNSRGVAFGFCTTMVRQSNLNAKSILVQKECLTKITEICNELDIKLNTKKTQIVKIERGINFLKTKFYLTDTGRVIRKPNRKGITKMRKKLKTFKTWVDNGKLTPEEVEMSYMSWQGHIKKYNSHKTIQSMDKLYKQLFKEDKKNDGTRSCFGT